MKFGDTNIYLLTLSFNTYLPRKIKQISFDITAELYLNIWSIQKSLA